MRMARILPVLLITVLLIFSACSSTTSPTLSPSTAPTLHQTSVETYSNARFGFSVNYPERWKVSEDDYPSGLGTTITFFKEGAAGVSILAWEPSQSPSFDFYSFDDFYERGVISSWQDHEGFKILEESDTLIDKLPARDVTFTYKSTDFVFKHAIVAFLDTSNDTTFSDSNAFKITYDMPVDMFEAYYPDFRLIVDSFKFAD